MEIEAGMGNNISLDDLISLKYKTKPGVTAENAHNGKLRCSINKSEGNLFLASVTFKMCQIFWAIA